MPMPKKPDAQLEITSQLMGIAIFLGACLIVA
jgi:hypothetical protein